MDVVVYTLARKFPRMIGKFPNGQPIPFGPFTFHQIGVLIGGLVLAFVALQGFDTPKLATAVIAAFVIVPGMAAARRIGFSMARIDSRLLWLLRPWIRRTPLATGSHPTTGITGPITTGHHRTPFEVD
jgi:hypothetical protein